MSNKNEVFEYLIDQLRQQVNNNLYKQQCEDLAHEVQSLKNQLRDASALVAELQKELESLGCEYRRVIDYALSDAPEQSGCRKGDTQDSELWIECDGAHPVPDDTVVDIKFRNGKVESNTKALWWSWGTSEGGHDIVAYRVVKLGRGPEQSGCRKEDTQDSEPWIEWSGGACPVPRGTLVDVAYRDGKTLNCLPADEIHCTARDASGSFWQHEDAPNDIVRYRRTTNQ